MPQRIIKKLFPAEKLQKSKFFKKFSHIFMHPQLWRLNRYTTSKSFFVGIFCACMPMPMQMVLAAGIALVVRCNLPVAVLLVWITNPITMLPMMYFNYLIGLLFFDKSLDYSNISFSLANFNLVWQPLLLGSIVVGLVTGSIGYIGIRIFWRWKIVASWRKRKTRT